jgi:hypothetical protein
MTSDDPSSRQVVRRTLVDLLALVPYTIIMIIPLSPPGHVFAFSLMKKCFPAAIPSPFTAQRQVRSRRFVTDGSGFVTDGSGFVTDGSGFAMDGGCLIRRGWSLTKLRLRSTGVPLMTG